MKIGITINSKSSLWSSGVNQNAIYLASALVKAGYEAVLITNVEVKESLETIESRGIQVIELAEALKQKFDVVISLGTSIWKYQMEIWKKINPNTKHVTYKCGNDFLIHSENFLYGAHKEVEADLNITLPQHAAPDQIWTIPQMENTNTAFYSFMERQDDVTVVPFIWNQMLTEELQAQHGFLDYDTSRVIKRTAVMEPNLNMMKHAIPPMIIMSKYLDLGHKMETLHLMSAKAKKETYAFSVMLNKGQLTQRMSVTANARIKTLDVLSNHADLVLSWQWENPLNYLYLDVAWHGYPLVHNADMCQDIGYYYHGFDLDEGARVLHRAVEEHNLDLEYKSRMRSIICRYTEENEDLLANYRKLIDNLVNEKFVKFKYDWQTNGILE